jgi:hypothetical protein
MGMHTTETPLNTDVNNGQQITLGTGFQLNVSSKTCYGVRFWGPGTNSGTYTAKLWQATADDSPGAGTELASKAVSSAGITAGAWNVILFDTPVSMSNANVYKSSVHTSSGRYVSRSGVFTSAGITGDDITLYQAGSDPVGLGSMLNGVFADGADAYPASAFNASDYYVEPVVTTSGLSAALGRVSVAETARAVGAAKARSAGRVTESHTARSATAAKARTAGRVVVSEAARTMGRTKTAALGRVVSPDTARAVSRAKSGGLARVSVAEQARPSTRLKSAALGRVVILEAARPVGAGLAASISRATVAEISRAVSRAKLRALSRVLVADNARGILRAQAAAVARVSEASSARTVGAISGSELIGQWGIDIGLG